MYVNSELKKLYEILKEYPQNLEYLFNQIKKWVQDKILSFHRFAKHSFLKETSWLVYTYMYYKGFYFLLFLIHWNSKVLNNHAFYIMNYMHRHEVTELL